MTVEDREPRNSVFISEQFIERVDPVTLRAEMLHYIRDGVDAFYVMHAGQSYSEFYASVVDRDGES